MLLLPMFKEIIFLLCNVLESFLFPQKENDFPFYTRKSITSKLFSFALLDASQCVLTKFNWTCWCQGFMGIIL